MRLLVWQDRAKEGALMAEDAAGFFRVFQSSLAFRVLHRLLAVVLVLRQRIKREHREGDVVCAFRWQEVPMMLTTKLLNQRDPKPSVVLKLLELEGIDYVT